MGLCTPLLVSTLASCRYTDDLVVVIDLKDLFYSRRKRIVRIDYVPIYLFFIRQPPVGRFLSCTSRVTTCLFRKLSFRSLLVRSRVTAAAKSGTESKLEGHVDMCEALYNQILLNRL